MIEVPPFIPTGLDVLNSANIDRVAQELRRLLSRPYRFRQKHPGASWMTVRCLRPDWQVTPSVTVIRSDGVLLLSVTDPRFAVPSWEVPGGAGFFKGLPNELYFRTVNDRDVQFYVEQL